MRTLLAASLLVTTCFACAADPDGDALGGDIGGGGGGGKADDARGGATLSFGDDWIERIDGTLRAGSTVRVAYDADRLPTCRGEQGGIPQWGITAYAAVDGGEPTVVGLRAGADAGIVEGTFELDDGADLEVWFSINNRWGCIAWDSNFGDNYGFAIAPASDDRATVRFAADGAVTLDGALVAGGDLVVEYDPARDETCRGTTYGNPAWGVTGYLEVDGGAATTFDPTQVSGTTRVTRPVTLAIPGDADTVSLWFQHTNRWGCVAWDSADGRNFVFDVE